MDQENIKTIIANSCEPPIESANLSNDLKLDGLGIDSLKLMLVVLDIEEAVGRRIFEVGQISRVETVGELVALAQA